jgi:hypothetical protein
MEGGFNAYAGFLHSLPALALFPTVCHPSCSFLRCHMVTIQIFLAVRVGISATYFLVSDAGNFLPSLCRGRYSQSGPFFTAPAIRLLCILLSDGAVYRLPKNILMLVLWDLAARNKTYSSYASLSALFIVSSPPISSTTFILWSSIPSANAFPASPLMRFSGRMG